MDASLKETEYDVLVLGTGMVEAILAGYGWSLNTGHTLCFVRMYPSVSVGRYELLIRVLLLVTGHWLEWGRKCCIWIRYSAIRARIVNVHCQDTDVSTIPHLFLLL